MAEAVVTEPSLISRYRGIVCDLDGVVYAGPVGIDGAVEALSAAGVPVVYATNNASRPPSVVADHLRSLGLTLEESDVVTSSTAGAGELARDLTPGDAVLAIGGIGVPTALIAAGLTPVSPEEHRAGRAVVAVLQGYGPQVSAGDLAEAALAVQSGARWVVTNEDLTLPTDRGLAPGNGSLVAAVRVAVDRDPVVMGKPHPPIYLRAAEVLGCSPAEAVAIGDRLETDIEGAVNTGMDGILVLTGVHGWADAAAAPPARRPKAVIADLRALQLPYAEPQRADEAWRCGESLATLTADGLQVVGGDEVQRGRAALAAVWEAVDDGRLTRDEAGARVGAALST
ncbi:HAD-IIA family hydrolase [Janibacter sp. G1551]|uniref:HAD-IIA family hydrolase n=1 Tax=Janibacter sp. G1551 TaxID=3420440 RepID=UPI003CFF06B2